MARISPHPAWYRERPHVPNVPWGGQYLLHTLLLLWKVGNGDRDRRAEKIEATWN